MFNSRYFITSVLVKKLSLTLGFSFIDSFVAGNPVKEKKNILTFVKDYNSDFIQGGYYHGDS